MSKSQKNLSATSKRMYMLSNDTPFVITEAYKTAVTNLIFSLATSQKKIVAFTSCAPSDGKSTTCANMAITMSEMGSKVLIIDADMRKPFAHRFFSIKNVNGLSSVLGGFCNGGEAINENIMNNLDIMSAGPIPPNSTELLASDNMKKLLEVLNEHYDYIFIDTPPVNVVSDALLLKTEIAGFVFVVKERVTTHPAIKEAFRRIEIADGKILGLVKTNSIGEGGTGYHKYKYSRYYRYGKSYTYGYGTSPKIDGDD